VILGGVVFPLLAGIYYWFPKFTGRMLDDRLGVASFWLTFLGMNVTFFTMHITGFLGMPRRVYTYLAGLGWDLVNLISTIGAFVIALGVLLYIVNILLAFQRPKGAPGNPWRSGTLEWAADSPPSFYNFRAQAYVRHRDPLWFEGLEGPEDQERLSRSEDIDLPSPEERYGVLARSEEHTSELQSRENLVCRL